MLNEQNGGLKKEMTEGLHLLVERGILLILYYVFKIFPIYWYFAGHFYQKYSIQL